MAAKLRRAHPKGTTLVELMVSATLFLLLMGAIMSFYSSGAKVTRQQDQRMETLRRSLRILDRIEVLLTNSRVIWLSSEEKTPNNQTIIFTPLSKNKHLLGMGTPWDASASRIYIKPTSSQSDGSGAGTGTSTETGAGSGAGTGTNTGTGAGSGAGTGTNTGTGAGSGAGADGSAIVNQGSEIFYCDKQGNNRLIGTLYPGESLKISSGTGVIKLNLTLNYYQNQKNISEEQQYKQERTIPLYNYINY